MQVHILESECYIDYEGDREILGIFSSLESVYKHISDNDIILGEIEVASDYGEEYIKVYCEYERTSKNFIYISKRNVID